MKPARIRDEVGTPRTPHCSSSPGGTLALASSPFWRGRAPPMTPQCSRLQENWSAERFEFSMMDDDEQLRPSAAEMAQNKPSPPLWHTKETVPKAVEHVQNRQSSTPFRRPHWTARRCRVAGLGPVPVPGSAPRGEMVDGASRWPASWALLAISASTTLVLSLSPAVSPSLPLVGCRARDAGANMHLGRGWWPTGPRQQGGGRVNSGSGIANVVAWAIA